MLRQLWFNPGSFCSISHRLLLILLVLQLGTQEAATAASSALDGAEQQLRVDSGQPSTSWFNFNGHWPLGDDSDGTCQPPMLWAPVKGNRSGSTVPKGQGSQASRQTQQRGADSSGGSRGASGASGQGNAASPNLDQRLSGGKNADEGKQQDDFTCKDHNDQVVSWFIVIKEHGSYNYVYMTSRSRTFSGLESNIHNSGPLYYTLEQTRQYRNALLFYSYTSHRSGDNEGHQNGVLLFGKSRGFWLIHSWRRFFEYFWNKDFRNPTSTNGQAFICTTHSTSSDLGNIGKQLFITKPHPYPRYEYMFDRKKFPNSYWIGIIDGAYVTQQGVSQSCGDQHSCKQSFNIGNQIKLMHYSKSRFDETDIYKWIATNNSIDGSSSCLKVQSWHTSGNQGKVQDVADHKYHQDMKSMNTKTDHSKWCVPVNIGAGRPPNEIKFVCIGDLNRVQTNRPGGAMCMWNDAVWQYFKNITKKCT